MGKHSVSARNGKKLSVRVDFFVPRSDKMVQTCHNSSNCLTFLRVEVVAAVGLRVLRDDGSSSSRRVGDLGDGVDEQTGVDASHSLKISLTPL